jgi:hypothetical protein
MRKHKLSYASVTVSKSYLDTYNTAFTATASNRAEANNAMQAIDAAWVQIATNAELWAEYKQVAAEAVEVYSDYQYSEESRAFLRDYYQNVYQKNLSALLLTNEELQQAIAEMREYIESMSTGGWTGISDLTTDNGQRTMDNRIWTLDGKHVESPQQSGLYIIRGSDGRFRKVVR